MTLNEYVITKTDKELIEELEGLNDIIDKVQCFNGRDILVRGYIEAELERRGILDETY